MRGSPRNSPKASPKRKCNTLQDLFNLDSRNNGSSRSSDHFNNSHSYIGRSISRSESEEILAVISSCTICIYNASDDPPSEYPSKSQHDLNRLKLMQLLSIIKSSEKPFPDQVLKPLFSMLSGHLFRPLPPPVYNTNLISNILPDDGEFVSTPTLAWPRLQVAYDILLQLLNTIDAKALRERVDQCFIINLLSLFQSEDPREREGLKNVFHRIYSKFTFHRSFMRKAMSDVFLHYVVETDQRHSGIGELLEIWGSIINGFTVPLKEEHKHFLMRVLIPLHKPKGMQVYHMQLAYCVSQFMQKEAVLGDMVVRGILRYWPVANCQKEVLLIGELEELVDSISPEYYRKLALPLCTKITKCLNSWNSQVAERALYVWNNQQFVKMTSQAMEDVFPILVEGMERNLKWHWSNSVKQLTENVKLMLEEMEPSLYSRCLAQLELQESASREEETRRKEKWERIEAAAARKQFLQQQHYICVSD